jgi:signal transduction histidine kinase
MAKDLPVIVLVKQGESRKAAEAVELGAQDYVFKECHCGSLLRTMQYAMERKRLIAEREEGYRRMTKDREELTAHLSHEFRNALACIYQFGNILMDGLAGPISEEQRDYLGIMLENASRIRCVLDQLLEGTSGGCGEVRANLHQQETRRAWTVQGY